MLHFHLGGGSYKRVPFKPQDRLLTIISSLKTWKSPPTDLRLKTRSLFNKVGSLSIENSDVTVGMCGLSPGDLIEVVDEGDHRQSFLCKLREKGLSSEDGIINYVKGNDACCWKERILNDFERLSDGQNSHTLFECITKGNKEYLRPLYDCEDLPRSLSVNDDSCLQLWKNCCYLRFDFTDDNTEPVTLEPHDFDWPWGNEDFDYWTWGLVIKRSASDTCIYLIATPDGGYMNLENMEQCVDRRFQPRISTIPGTAIAERDPRQVSLFIAFIEDEDSFEEIKDRIVLMTRNHSLNEPRGEKSKKNGLFWTCKNAS